MEVRINDHRSGLKVVPPEIIDDVTLLIKTISPKISKNCVSAIKNEIKEKLAKNGWSGEFRLDTYSKITITSAKQNIGLCLQTGNIGRLYADLLKLQTLFTKGAIRGGVLLVPEQYTARKLGSNMANDERLIRELPIFNQVITVPLVIIGFIGTEDR